MSKEIVLSVVVVLLVIGGLFGWGWYKAGVQANIYHRQGIEITQWECFIGVSPAEKVIQIKDTKKE